MFLCCTKPSIYTTNLLCRGSDDFRPKFRHLVQFRASLSVCPVLMMTATATMAIRQECLEIMGLYHHEIVESYDGLSEAIDVC